MKKNFKKLLFSIILVAVCALTVGVVSGLFVVQPSNSTVDYVSTQRYTERDGTIADVYASGDQYYNYLHDADGKMLVEQDGFLYYATLNNGRPTATATRWNAPKRQVKRTATMSAAEIDFEANLDLLREFPSDTEPFNKANFLPEQQIANNVIFIRFKDDATNIVSEGVKRAFDNTDGANDTLRDYFQTISNGNINIYNILPTNQDGSVYVYTDANPRSYYQNATSINRKARERELLSAALNAAKPYLEQQMQKLGLRADADRDGKVDSINFMILGSSSDTWSTLLWPHQWDMASIGVNIRLDSALAARYSFQFTVDTRFFAVLTHEMGHVFGANDLYHYGNTNYDPVRFYDNMASSSVNPPNYWFTYTREKYLGVVEGWQIEDIVANWDGYTLRAVSAATANDTLAYRIRLSANEFLYLEYRKPNVGKYDNNFDRSLNSVASGLVAYRVVEGVVGNSDAVAPGAGYQKKPDEVYVFRKNSIQTAALNMSNPSLGSETNASLYADGNIYTKSGMNTKLVITVLEEDFINNSVRFKVHSPNLPDGGEIFGSTKLVGITTETQEVIDVPYDSDLPLKICPIIEKNGIRFTSFSALSSDCYKVSDYNRVATDFMEQQVTITLIPDSPHGYMLETGVEIQPITVKIRVTDYDKAIEIISWTANRFPVMQSDGFVSEWRIKTAMGKDKNFNFQSEETAQLTYKGVDIAEVGEKPITVVFNKLSVTATLEFFDQPIYYRYVGEERFPFGKTNVGAFRYRVFYASGATRNIEQTAIEVGFDPMTFGAQTLRSVWFEDGQQFVVEKTVYTYKTAIGASPYKLKRNGQETSRDISLNYAGALSLADYTVEVTCDDKSVVELNFLQKQNAAVLYTINTALKFMFEEINYQNKQLVVEIYIKVEIKVENEVFSLKGFSANINYKDQIIILKNATTAQDLIKSVVTADYLSVTLGAKGDENAANVTLKVQNSVWIDGVLMTLDVPNFTFKVLLKGDANLDGVTDRKDIDVMADCLVGNIKFNAQQLSFDADNLFTFTDFSRWLLKLTVSEVENAA